MHVALKARFSADGDLFRRRNDARPTRLKRAFSAFGSAISIPGAIPQAEMRQRPWRKTPTYAVEEVVLVFGCSGPLNVLRA